MTTTATTATVPATPAASATLLAAFKSGLLATLPVLAPAIAAAIQPLIQEVGNGVAKAIGITKPDTVTKIDMALIAAGAAIGAVVADKLGGTAGAAVSQIAAGA